MIKLITISHFFSNSRHYWTEGAQKIAKAIVEIWKPGANNEVAALPYVPNSKLLMVSY